MILLTRFDGRPVVVNEDLLLFVERTPDTVLTFSNGQRLMIRESVDDVVERVARFRARVRETAWPGPPDAADVFPPEGED